MPEEENNIDPVFERLLEGADLQDVLSDGELSPMVDTMANYLLSESPDTPLPEGAKKRMLDAVAELEGTSDQEKDKIIPISEPEKPGGGMASIIPWSLAACFAGLCAVLLVEYNSVKGSLTNLENAEKQFAEQLYQATLADEADITILETQTEVESAALALWNAETQKVTLRCVGLKPLDPAINDYQLWIVDPQYNVPVDGGIFQANAEGAVTHVFKAPLKVDQAAAFAITKEVKGGVEVSDGPHLLLGASE